MGREEGRVLDFTAGGMCVWREEGKGLDFTAGGMCVGREEGRGVWGREREGREIEYSPS